MGVVVQVAAGSSLISDPPARPSEFTPLTDISRCFERLLLYIRSGVIDHCHWLWGHCVGIWKQDTLGMFTTAIYGSYCTYTIFTLEIFPGFEADRQCDGRHS